VLFYIEFYIGHSLHMIFCSCFPCASQPTTLTNLSTP